MSSSVSGSASGSVVSSVSGAGPGLVTALDLLIFSGSYDLVLSRTAGHYADAEAPAVVAALALSGRLDEAESVFDARLRARRADADVLRARFFLVAGLCHAGHPERALRYARESAAHVLGAAAGERYWSSQGLALVRHFEGRLDRARRLARRALGAAVLADFPYGRFLSLDLLAHVAVQCGEIHAGMRLLTQAAALAESLGYAENAATEHAMQLIFQLRFAVAERDTALSAVRELVAAEGVSYFTRRNGLLELSAAHALRGEARLARQSLDEAQQIALPGADRRARVRWLCAHALCMALAEGAATARESLDEARRHARDQLTLRAEIGFVELIFCAPAAAVAVSEMEQLAAQTHAQRARVAWLIAAGRPGLFPPRVEDGLCRLLLELSGLSAAERVRRVIEARWLGLLPWALGVEPGRRLIVLGTRLVTEHHGSLNLAELKTRSVLKLLLELRRGYRSRAELLRDVWNISHFVPLRHLPTLHTAISRLRLAVAEPDWVLTHDEGYSLELGIEVVLLGEADVLSAADEDSLTSIPAPPDDRDRVLSFILRQGATSSGDVARALRLSASSVLRVLRRLCAEGLLEREGGGRSTRYRRAGGPRDVKA
jgi:Winged helix-turn-helix DNA-binding